MYRDTLPLNMDRDTLPLNMDRDTLPLNMYRDTLPLNMYRDTLPLNMYRDTLPSTCTGILSPSIWTGILSPSIWTGILSPSIWTGILSPSICTGILSPSIWTGILSPSIWTGILSPTIWTGILSPSIWTGILSPSIWTGILSPSIWTGILSPSIWTGILSPSIWTGILSPSIWTGILIITCQVRVLPAFIPLPLNMDRDTYYYLSDQCSPRIHPSPPQYGQGYSPPQYGQGYLLLLVRSVFSPHSSLSPLIWTGILIITCQIRVLPAFIPLPLNMDRDTYYYLSEPCSPRIHPSPPQYGQGYSPPQYRQGYLLLFVRSVFSPHSSLSPSIWTGILIITCQIRVLPAFIPLPLNMDRDTYYYLSDSCSPRIHPSRPQYGQGYSPPQYGQGYLLLLVRSVFSPHSSLSPSIWTGILSPSIWTGILIITCQIRVLPAFIPLPLNMDRDTLPLNMDRDAYYYLSDPCSPRIHPSPPQYGQGYLLLLVRSVFSPHSSLSPSIWTGILIITCQIRAGSIHPSPFQYGQGYLLLLVISVFSPHSSLSPSIWTGILIITIRSVFSPHSSLSPSIWTGILIITCQIRVLPAFIPLPLNMDRDTYYYLSDPCSPRIHPSPPQYGQGYLLLLFRSVFSPHSSLSPSIWTGVLIITCQIRVLPAFIPLPLNMDRDAYYY